MELHLASNERSFLRVVKLVCMVSKATMFFYSVLDERAH